MFARASKKKVAIVAAAAVVVALAGGGVALAMTLNQQPEEPAATPEQTPTQTPSATPTPTPTPTPEPVELPASVPVDGTIEGWEGASVAQLAQVSAQVGEAADGAAAAYVDAPVVDEPVTALSSVVALEPGATYSFSAQVRQLTPLPEEAPVAFTIGDQRIEVPELDASWQEVTGEVTVPEGQGETRLGILVEGPVAGLGVDQLSLTPKDGGDNLVFNPSFESISTDRGILNDALILRERSAAIAVSLAEGDANWRVTRGDDSVAAEGTVPLRAGATAIPLEGVTQGYYRVSVTDAAGATVSAPIAVIDHDGPRIAPDERIGAITHVDQPWYEDAADTLSAMGFGAARNDVLWEQNERTPGVYEFGAHYTAEFDKMHAHGVGLLGIVNYGNPLYDGGNPPSSPQAVEAYGAYAAAIADRFDVVGLEVFNEFNHERFNTGGCGTAPSCYLPLIQSVESHVDESIPVVAGSTANFDAEWFRGLWPTGALAHSDAMSFHPYNPSYYQRPENLTEAIATANRDMKELGGSTIPIWITEFGWTTGNELGQARSLDVQAQSLIAAQTVSLGEGVEKYFWYDLVDDSTDPNNHEGNFGMFYQRAGDVAAHAPKPAAFAQALLINELGGREAAGRDDMGDGVFSYLFGDAGDGVRVAWAPDGDQTVTYEASGPIRMTDLTGKVTTLKPKDGVVEVPLGARAVLLAGDFSPADEPEPSPTRTPAPTSSPSETPARPQD